jgi:selenocysteine lyase/cysteine desulfurase
MAIRTLVKPGSRVVISGFEHNAVTRPLHGLGADVHVAGRKLFDQADTLQSFEAALRKGMDAAVFTHVSNVFGYILPVEELARRTGLTRRAVHMRIFRTRERLRAYLTERGYGV